MTLEMREFEAVLELNTCVHLSSVILSNEGPYIYQALELENSVCTKQNSVVKSPKSELVLINRWQILCYLTLLPFYFSFATWNDLLYVNRITT